MGAFLPLLLTAASLYTPFSQAQAPSSGATTQHRVHTKIGFASKKALREHYRAHGRSFGKITEAEYLFMAQDLRDRPLDMKTLEAVVRNGLIFRYSRATGAFVAFKKNLVILEFEKPVTGEKYFYARQRRARRR